MAYCYVLFSNFKSCISRPYERYNKGASYFGFDQFAQYYAVLINTTLYSPDSEITVTGAFYRAAYFSITSYAYSSSLQLGIPVFHATSAMLPLADTRDSNPYLAGNPSVLAYAAPTFRFDSAQTAAAEAAWLSDLSSSSSETIGPLQSTTAASGQAAAASSASGKVPFYRLDANTSTNCLSDSYQAAGDCSAEYVFAPTTPESSHGQVYIVCMRVPKTFFNSSQPPPVYGDDYDLTYFSISANRNTTIQQANLNRTFDVSELLPKYWTVNAGMMSRTIDESGYAYVFCVPDPYARALWLTQNRESRIDRTTPPVLSWGQYTGYALGEASFAIILRYKEPSDAWEGSPKRAACYPTLGENQPLPDDALGDYTPQAYQGSFESFEKGHIGAVQQNSPWP